MRLWRRPAADHFTRADPAYGLTAASRDLDEALRALDQLPQQAGLAIGFHQYCGETQRYRS